MEGSRFDGLTRSLVASRSRRRLLRGLAAAVVAGGVVAPHGVAHAKKPQVVTINDVAAADLPAFKRRKRRHAKCSAKNCASGCCANGQCHLSDPQFCGTAAGLCVICAAREQCVDGQCLQAPCDASTCPTGCCANGQCHVHDPQLCGSGGGLCASCSAGQECFSGKCTAGQVRICPATGTCTTKPADCPGFGCLQTTEGDFICPCTEFSSTCTNSAQCPAGQFCVLKDAVNQTCILVGGNSACVVSC